jgi:deoxyribonuclease V
VSFDAGGILPRDQSGGNEEIRARARASGARIVKRVMRGKNDPDWPAIVERWKAEQQEMRRRMVVAPLRPLPRFVAGADAAFSTDPPKRTVFAAAVVYDRVERRVVEVAHAKRAAEFPYIPGFLSFREGPAVLEAVGKLKHAWGAICFDAHGYAHPRRCGLAAHLSIQLDVPGVGVAKSRLIGVHSDPPAEAGAFSDLTDKGEQIGIVLRTRDNTRPVYISLGHRVDLDSARELALACVTRYRVPEPTRQADIEVAKLKRL